MTEIDKYLSGSVSWSKANEKEVLRGYQVMAEDEAREREAHEWADALIADGLVLLKGTPSGVPTKSKVGKGS